MLTKKDILNLYNKYNVQASKRFGQNFLFDEKVIEAIIDSSEINNIDVIEIGPGLGSLTNELLKKAKKVTAYEIDQDMYKVLSSEINDPKLELKLVDFLTENFEWNGKKKVVANIPYNITSPILFKLFKSIHKFESATLMIQKEVGERLLAKPQQKNYGKLSVTTQLLANVEKIIDVPSTSFVPAPKVDSVVVKLSFKTNTYNQALFDFIKLAFSQQRKKLINNLKTKYDPSKIEEILTDLNIDKNIRPQQIDVQKFVEIYNKL